MTIGGVKIAIDRGGTFTDVLAMIPGQKDYMFKLLSVDPGNYKDANIEGIRRVLEHVQQRKIPKGTPLDTSCVSSIRLGTTVATNALLERKGERTAFLVTKGFKDILRIGDQTRPDLFALNVIKPEPLYDTVVEIDEKVTIPSATEDPETCNYSSLVDNQRYVLGESKDVYEIIKTLDENDTKIKLQLLKEQGYKSIAICLIHGYSFQTHEKKLKALAQEVGFDNVSVSHELIAMIGAIPRSQSTVCDGYLTPIIKEYIKNFLSGFAENTESTTRIEFMQSDGGLCSWKSFSGLKALLSGPAGGVVGEAQTCYDAEDGTPIVGFDMGGTSTDVSRYAGNYELVFKSITAGVQIAAPQLDINTVAAGGGSILSYEFGVFKVGPESAGAHPGPACYRKGGPLTITDANLFTGRILPKFFPHIFGPNEDQPLDFDIVEQKFNQLTKKINIDNPDKQMSAYEVALGFLKVANFSMAKPIRTLTESRGYDVSKHNLASFGGAGGQHATSIASILKMKRVVIHRYSSILSAYGIALADVVQEEQSPCHEVYNPDNRDKLIVDCHKLATKASEKLFDQSIDQSSVDVEIFFNMGYAGSDTSLMISQPKDNDFHKVFTELHKREFSFVDEGRDVIVRDIRVRATGSLSKPEKVSPYKDLAELKSQNQISTVATNLELATSKVYYEEGLLDTKVYLLDAIPVGSIVHGPALILDTTQTILVTPNSKANILNEHVLIDLKGDSSDDAPVDDGFTPKVIDPILLSIFTNRFESIAENMGLTLQKVSVSPNIKERLDFSCAIFTDDGTLNSSAHFIPIHVGGMSNCIKYAKKYWGDDVHPGDVFVTNSPTTGGTHLPDITVISPVFREGKVRFFVASRGHHSDIGGSVPGSSDATATSLEEEGVHIKAWRMISKGVFDYDGIQKYFVDEPSSYEGCSGCRKLEDNVSDLKAQVASNQRGINLLSELFEEYGSETVLFYMKAIESTAETVVRGLLKKVAKQNRGSLPLKAEEILDDGSKICVSIDISEDDGSAIYDFTGSSEEAFNCGNAPVSITYACVMYCLRLMVNADIPLNDGCLNPVKLIIPEGTILNPSPYAAVSAANSATAQRLTDTILKAFEIAGASSGSNNTLAFGKGGIENGVMKQGFAFVETIGGGIGAIDGHDGYSGCHCHMTNTKITDPEVIELRYPVILHEFTIRNGSGGDGQFKGGDGLIRLYEFTTDLSCTLRTQRRVNAPYGMKGGKASLRGENRLGRKRNDIIQWIALPSFAQFKVKAGDFVKIRTPGGGGYGTPVKSSNGCKSPSPSNFVPLAGGSIAARNELGVTSQ